MAFFIFMTLVIGSVVFSEFAENRLRKRLQLEALSAHEDLNIEDDEDVINYLEAAGECTPFAREVLQAARDIQRSRVLPPHDELIVLEEFPKYAHNPNEKVPCEVQWKIFVEDMKREYVDEDRLEVLRHWLKTSNVFTKTEYGMILDMFEGAEYRRCARDLFSQHDRGDKKAG